MKIDVRKPCSVDEDVKDERTADQTVDALSCISAMACS